MDKEQIRFLSSRGRPAVRSFIACFGVLGIASAAQFAMIACSASSGAPAFDNSTPASNNYGGGQGSAPSTPFAPPASTGAAGDPNSGPGLTGVVDPSSQDAAPCVATTHQGEAIPLDIFVIWDRSGSMDDDVNGGTKWDLVVAAFEAFLNDPASAGIGVGIQYFPLSSDGDLPDDRNTSCNIPDYSVAAVPVAPLPGNAGPVMGSIRALSPSGRTPTRVGLQGAADYARSWAIQHPERKVVVLLQTDGEPNVCESTVQAVSDVAAGAFAGTPSLPTYVIGVGSELRNLDQIAQAGGTSHAFIVDTTQNTTQQFVDAMNSIRGSANIPCDFLIPPGVTVDFNRVNVQFMPPGGSVAIQLLNAPTEAQCDPVSGGWFYDDPVRPMRIRLCKSSCDAVVSQPDGQVDVLLGCKTLPITIH